MFNSFPVTYVKRPVLIYGRGYNSLVSVGVLQWDGLINSFSTISPPASALLQDIDNDYMVYGTATGIKYTAYTGNKGQILASSSWAANGNAGFAGYNSREQKLYTYSHGGPNQWFDYNYNPSTYLGATTPNNTSNWPAPVLQYCNNTTIHTRGKCFAGGSAGTNSNGGVIIVYNTTSTSSLYLNCSGSGASLSRVASPGLDVRRNRIWSYNGTALQIVAHDVDSGQIVQTINWTITTDNPANVNNCIYISTRDELWVSGYSNNLIHIYNFTTSTYRQLNCSVLGLPSWTGTAGGLYALALGGGGEKIQ